MASTDFKIALAFKQVYFSEFTENCSEELNRLGFKAEIRNEIHQYLKAIESAKSQPELNKEEK